jgi:hypothetical protein
VNQSTTRTEAWLWLTVPISVLLAITAGGWVFINGLCRDTPAFAARARGQNLVSLVIVLPALIISAFLAHHGSPRARLLWLGGLVYLVYTYIAAAFDVKLNLLFLVYVALLGCALYALIGGLVMENMGGTRVSLTNKLPVKAVSIYLAGLAVLSYFTWWTDIIAAFMAGRIPQSIQDIGTPANAGARIGYGLDLLHHVEGILA